MSYNLNDDQFDKSNTKIFNDGNSGRVKCIFSKIVPKTENDKETGPDYKLFFKDEEGAEINVGFWILDENGQYFDKNILRDGKRFKELIYTLCGEGTPLPVAETPEQLLRASMGMIQDKVGAEVHIAVNYGVTASPKGYLNVRGFVPFIESAAKTEENTVLKVLNFEQLVAVRPDAPAGQQAEAPAGKMDWMKS